MTESTGGVLPALNPGDVYIYAHGNGAIFVMHSDGRSLLAPLADALAIAIDRHAAGSRIIVASDEQPLGTDVLDTIRDHAVLTEDFTPSKPPHRWSEGTDALMEAASVGSNRILDDLLDRGVDIHRRDQSGSTALHHAAANGNTHAIEALIRAGADATLTNRARCTARMLAVASGQAAAAAALEEPRNERPAATGGTLAFHRAHIATVYVWLLPLVTMAALGGLLWPFDLRVAIGLATFIAGYASVVPGRAFWAGGVPRCLDGNDLTIRHPTARIEVIDLTKVTAAGLGGTTHLSRRSGARWILLAHPDGCMVTRRALRRLMVPKDELDSLLGRADRFVVIPLSGGRWGEVIGPVGRLLIGQGTFLTPSLLRQVTQV